MQMTEQQKRLVTDVAAVLSTLGEVCDHADEQTSTVAESTFYLALDSEPRRWELVKQVLLRGELATFAHSRVKLTAEGKKLAKQILEATD